MIWGYIASAVCASCPRQETIDHCFLNCATVKVVLFVPIVKSVSGSRFVVDPPCFFFRWPTSENKKERVSRFVTKTISYGILV